MTSNIYRYFWNKIHGPKSSSYKVLTFCSDATPWKEYAGHGIRPQVNHMRRYGNDIEVTHPMPTKHNDAGWDFKDIQEKRQDEGLSSITV